MVNFLNKEIRDGNEGSGVRIDGPRKTEEDRVGGRQGGTQEGDRT